MVGKLPSLPLRIMLRTFQPPTIDALVLTQRRVTAAQAGLAICSEPSRAKRVPRGAEYAEVFRLDFSRAERVDRVEAW